MVERYERLWSGEDWQEFAFALVQLRHGATNVQRVPDGVRGDGGLEFFTTDGCLVQCYAPQEVSDVAKSSSAMKQKATRDLPKLAQYQDIISRMLQTIKARRWILLCPFLDDKDVVAHVRKKGIELFNAQLPFLTPDFEALVHSQEDFAIEVRALREKAIGPSLRTKQPDETFIEQQSKSSFSSKLDEKLSRAFAGLSAEQLEEKSKDHLRSFFQRENAIEQLRLNYPTTWERYVNSVTAEEKRLKLIGAAGTGPREQLAESLQRIEDGLKRDIPDLSQSTRTDLATGTLSDWLIRCPLDFT